jgi:hypothetical protein
MGWAPTAAPPEALVEPAVVLVIKAGGQCREVGLLSRLVEQAEVAGIRGDCIVVQWTGERSIPEGVLSPVQLRVAEQLRAADVDEIVGYWMIRTSCARDEEGASVARRWEDRETGVCGSAARDRVWSEEDSKPLLPS